MGVPPLKVHFDLAGGDSPVGRAGGCVLSGARGMAFRDDSTDLLEIAIGYAVGSLSCVTPGSLSYPTPCAA